MAIYVILLFFSGILSLTIIARNFFRVFRAAKNGEDINLNQNYSVFDKADKYIAAPIKFFFENRFLPALYKEIEKFFRQSRIYILKIENRLFKFINYMKGKRIIRENGNPSEYIQKLNGLNESEKPL